MNTKKINELTILEQATAETNVLVEQNGTASRIPASALGGGSEKALVEKLAPAFTKTAPVVTCNPVEGHPLEVVSHITGGRSQNLIADYSTNDAYSEPTIAVDLPVGKYILWYKGESGLRVCANTEDNQLVFIPAPFDEAKETTINHPGGLMLIADTDWMTTFDESNLILTMVTGGAASVTLTHNGKNTTVDFPVEVSSGTFNWSTGVLTEGNPNTEYTGEESNTYQLTPHEIIGLAGVNTLSGNTGDTEVSGRADPAFVINDLYSKLSALSEG